jgi:glycerol-3-phosphate O-acyltransferase
MRRMLKGIHNIEGIQDIVKVFIDKMLSKTSTSFTISGLEQLDKDRNYLFIGNHRDIVLDPALVNYALKICGYPTVRIAIGDNLQSKSFISDLMRLNKSFIVKRSVKGPREKVRALRHLSKYIAHSVLKDHSNVWIAQGEGRAKDGRDITQPAIIKMLAMSKSSEEEFSSYIKSLSIVPVAISYELDPCDADKARELFIRETGGSYQKRPTEDFESISKGIKGNKGGIHLSFGVPLDRAYDSAEEVANEIDRQITTIYRAQDTNKMCHQLKSQGSIGEIISTTKAIGFEQRLSNIPDTYRSYAIDMYANVVERKLDLGLTEDESVTNNNSNN